MMVTRNGTDYNSENRTGNATPYMGKERRIENDPSYFGYFALEGIERRQASVNKYTGEDRRMASDPGYFGYFALEGIERRQANTIFG